jgi:nucleotide-binding universal stress UspA family protein
MRHVLVCVDFSPVTSVVVAHAADLARATGAEVRLLYVAAPEPEFVGYDPGPASVRDGVAHQLRDQHRELGLLAETIERSGVPATPLMIQGSTVDTIIDQVQRLGAHLVVIGAHGRGALSTLLVGNVTEGVLRRCPVPVVVVPSTAAPPAAP